MLATEALVKSIGMCRHVSSTAHIFYLYYFMRMLRISCGLVRFAVVLNSVLIVWRNSIKYHFNREFVVIENRLSSLKEY